MADISKITLPNGSEYSIKDATARAQSGVTGVKGNSESSYRTGNVNLTPDNLGAITKNEQGNTQYLKRPKRLNGANDNTLDSKINTLRANRLAFLPADQIIIEKTTDGGATWVDGNIADSTKTGLFSETRDGINIPKLDGVKSILCGVRITFTAMKYNVPSGTPETQKYQYWNKDYAISTERYNQLKEMYFWVSVGYDTLNVKLERSTGANPNTWSTAFSDESWGMTGWSGNDYISFGQGVFGGGTSQTSNYWNYRLTLMTRGPNGGTDMSPTSPTASQSVYEIRGYGDTWWTKGNEYAANDKLYSHDYLKNAKFPANIQPTSDNVSTLGTSSYRWNNVYSETFTGNLTGTATNASKVNNHTVQTDVPVNAVFTDTTYESKSAASGGTAVSLCTTGEKYTWNNKSTVPTNHASTATTYGAGSSSNYGHVKLSASTSSTSAESGGIAATPSAVKSAYDLANTANSTANTALSGVNGGLIYDHTFTISNGVATFTPHVYKAGSEVTTEYAVSCFSWKYRLIDGSEVTLTTKSDRGCDVTISNMGYGGHVIGLFTPA